MEGVTQEPVSPTADSPTLGPADATDPNAPVPKASNKPTPLVDEGVYTVRVTDKNIAVIEPGTIEHIDGSRFEGQIKKGLREGKGTMFYASGDVYEGMWTSDKRNGEGKLTSKVGGGSYVGEWRDDRMHGRGKETFANGAKYDGEYVYGKMHGSGVMIYPNGNRYEGEWQNDKRHGKGIITYPNGDIFEGSFIEGKRQGESFITYSVGRKYSAEWKNDQMVDGTMKFVCEIVKEPDPAEAIPEAKPAAKK